MRSIRMACIARSLHCMPHLLGNSHVLVHTFMFVLLRQPALYKSSAPTWSCDVQRYTYVLLNRHLLPCAQSKGPQVVAIVTGEDEVRVLDIHGCMVSTYRRSVVQSCNTVQYYAPEYSTALCMESANVWHPSMHPCIPYTTSIAHPTPVAHCCKHACCGEKGTTMVDRTVQCPTCSTPS